MREARIILPQGFAAAERWLRAELVRQFGGYTATPAQGGWANGKGDPVDEPITVFDVACNGSYRDNAALEFLAREVGRRAEQEAVYLRYPDGEIDILPIINPPTTTGGEQPYSAASLLRSRPKREGLSHD